MAIALSVCELLVRLTDPDWMGRGNEKFGFCVFDPDIGWINKAGARGRFRQRDFDVDVSINSQGLRDKEHSYNKTANVFRIAVLGDSFAWGYGVERRQRFSELLTRDVPGLETINFGCSGYGTDQELLLLQRRGLEYHPDLVLVLMHPRTDLDDNLYSYRNHYEKPLFFLEGEKLELTNVPVPRERLVERLDRRLRANSALWNLLGERMFHGNRIVDIILDGVDRLVSGTPHRVKKANLSGPRMACRLSRLIRNVSASRGARTLFVLIPDIAPGRQEILKDDRWEELSRCLKDNGIPALDLSPAFLGFFSRRPGIPVTFDHDPHWNALGHEVAAAAIRRYLDGFKRPGLRGAAVGIGGDRTLGL